MCGPPAATSSHRPASTPRPRRSTNGTPSDIPSSTAIADAPAWLLELVCGKNRRQRERSHDHGKRTMGGDGSPAGSSGGRYAEAALQDESRAVAQTASGGRNDRLNEAAFNLGQLVGGRELERSRVERRLVAAAEQCGLIADDGLPAGRPPSGAVWRTVWRSRGRGLRATAVMSPVASPMARMAPRRMAERGAPEWPFRLTLRGVERRVEKEDRETGEVTIEWVWMCSPLDVAADTRDGNGPGLGPPAADHRP